jgi:YHS domain-containing protein
MSERTRFPGKALILTLLAMAVLIFFWGCAKEQPDSHEDHTGHDHGSHEHAATASQPAAGTVAIEQKTCPVMEGNPINKNLFVEYKGKKVYFCCAGCPETFLANPEKYLSKLPQFQD